MAAPLTPEDIARAVEIVAGCVSGRYIERSVREADSLASAAKDLKHLYQGGMFSHPVCVFSADKGVAMHIYPEGKRDKPIRAGTISWLDVAKIMRQEAKQMSLFEVM